KVPESLLLPATGDDKEGFSVAYLPASAVVCSCNNVTKGDLVEAIRNGEATDINDLKQCTKGGSGCGGCVPLMKDILNLELENIGVKVDTSLCEHFAYDRSELRALVKENKIYRFEDVLSKLGQGQGCETCRPAVASILAGCWGEHVMNNQNILDTNDYLMANMQKNGTYSVVPRAAGGEITPDQLIAIGQVAKDFNLYSKITGGQRIDLFGARREDLPKIWKVLIDAGLESGLAYGKSLRTVKSCVGSTWCRFGVQDSVAFAIELENRYKGLRAPHKVKGGVSGCIRECAEARGKDFGVIATDKGWNLYICGNGGAKPQHAELLAADIDKETLIQYLDRFLMYYVRTAPHLSRTSTWLVNLDGGMDDVKDVVINDSLGLAEELEAEMQNIVDNYECEWKRAIEDPEKLKRFNPYLNSDASDDSAKFVEVRGQKRPATPEEVEAMTKKKKSAVVA
ncbi:MAG: nitrite reductase (NADH) large subunit, partial [bacterium]